MRRTLLAALGGVGAAFVGTLCCIGPLIFVTFGVGAGLAAMFEPLRPLFGVLMAGAFAVAFYTVYGQGGTRRAKGEPSCAAEGACAVPRSRRREKAIFWTAVVIAIVAWTFPTWSTWLL